ncbi:MAG: YcnI family protein, partial [Nocardioides sp.]|nr:YcnI family protein [Nocardioides sp.]
MKLNRILARAAVVPVVVGSAFLAASPASAHVSVAASSTAAGSSSILTFSVPHGCDGSATNKIAIKMPEDILTVTPTRNAFYDVKTVKQQLDEPVTDAHGNTLTERVSQIVYSAKTPLPDGQRDTFELSVSLPDAEGETLAFPVIQSCVKGQTAWTERAAEGQDGEKLAGEELAGEELESPAPLVMITAPEEGDDG